MNTVIYANTKEFLLPKSAPSVKALFANAVFNEILEKVRDVISHKPVCIAGGAIRDSLMLGEEKFKDIDVWILDSDESDARAYAPKLEWAFGGSASPIMYVNQPFAMVWNTRYPFTSPNEYVGGVIALRKMPEKSYPVQIVCHKAKTVEALIYDFDWRACQFAYDGKRHWDSGTQDFWNHKLKLVNARNPIHTLRRGFYLENKYKQSPHGVQVPKEDILTLASMILLDPEAH